MSCVWLALVRALNVRNKGTISAGKVEVSCCVTFNVLPAVRIRNGQLERSAMNRFFVNMTGYNT